MCGAIVFIRYTSAFPRRDTPELCMNCAPRKTEGVGNAGCPMHPQPRVRNKIKHTSVVTEGSPDSPGIPARNGFNGLFRALPGERIRLVTVISGFQVLQTRSGRLHLRKFNTSNGCQDHTALPSATTSFVCAPRSLTGLIDLPCD